MGSDEEPVPNRSVVMGLIGFIVYLVIVVLLAELTRPKPNLELAKPKNISEFDFPTATEGRVVPIIWGKVRISGMNVIWYGLLEQTAIGEYVPSGFFDTSFQIQGYKYRMGVQRALCMGVVDKWTGFWIGDNHVWAGVKTHGQTLAIDAPELFGGNKLGQGGWVGELEFFAGLNNQAVSAFLTGNLVVSGASPQDGGTGYAVGDTLIDASATAGEASPASFRVGLIDPGGIVTKAIRTSRGVYDLDYPTNPVAKSTDGSGTGCTLNLSQIFQGAQIVNGFQGPAYHDLCYV